MDKKISILGIETSCDETGIALYYPEKGTIIQKLFSQIELHKKYGGVIPEIAARSQLHKIETLVSSLMHDASLAYADLSAIAVTHKPGLPSSLLVGVCFAKALAYSISCPLIGINHIEGHIFSALIENDVPFPHLCLTASGGHTSLYYVTDYGSYQVVGTTHDDAAGEAFDKIAKLLELEYPGGPLIEKLAADGGFHDYMRYPRNKGQSCDFSFSGLKTAVLYDLIKRGAYNKENKKLIDTSIDLKKQVSSSLLVCIADIFEQKIEYAHHLYPDIKAITFVGGVACNKYIKKRLYDWCHARHLSFFSPSPGYCTDNGAMIAFVGAYKARKGEFSDLSLDIMV